jgi:thiamine biosynthesis lipoprotein
MESRRFAAMGTEIELLVDAERSAAALDAAESEFHRLEALLSRFRDDSELSKLNASGSIEAGPDLVRVVELAVDACARTGGRFDPTVHDALVAAGYDRSFPLVASDEPSDVDVGVHRRLHRCTPSHRGAGVRVTGGRIELDPGVRLDLGGIGKGYAAERAAELLATAGPCLVNAGGDVATRGGSWPIGVETSGEPLTLELAGGHALATSGRDRRRWRRNGRELHHLIDPATGAPAESDLLRVTVVADDAVAAEVEAKALFLAGAERATEEAGVAAIAAVLLTGDGRTILTGGLA